MAHLNPMPAPTPFPVAGASLILLLLTAASAGYLLRSSITPNSTRNAQPGASRLQELLGCWQAPGLAAEPKALDADALQKLQFKHYYVSTSTIPGAGLGVFARHDMPKGFIWNVEDASPSSSLNFTRAQWDSITKITGAFEAAGVKHHAMFDLVSLIRRYPYHCKEANLMMLSLTGATLTNHAARQKPKQTTVAGRESKDTASNTSTEATFTRVFVRNCVPAWPQNAADAARLAAKLGVKAPSLTERCVLSRTMRAIKAGEELLEDYETYDCPWFGCNSPVEAVRNC